MKVLADAGPIYNGQLTGVGYFTDELLKHLSTKTDLTGYSFNFRGKKQVSVTYPVLEQTVVPGKALTYPRYLKADLPLSLFFGVKKFDIVLGTNYLIPPTGKVPSIPIVHDLGFVDHPEWVQGRNALILRTMLPKTLARSKALITISEFSADRIRRVFGYKKPILVIDIPPKKSVAGAEKPKSVNLEKKGYFLFISTIEPRKNIKTLLDAYENLPPEVQKKNKFVLAGKPGWDPETLERLRSGSNKNIHYLDYVTESERNWLYKNCIATVIPSHYEGFGMMSLESLDAGSPTILSNIPPHVEIMGKYGEFFDVLDTAQLTNLLKKFTDPKVQSESYKRQSVVLKKYSWSKTAESVANFLEEQLK
jgi:glycosyltransferase involved in cell wall biosynthesis